MSDELIDSYIDRQKLQADTEFFVSEIKRASAAFESLNNTKKNIRLSTNFKDVIDANKLVEQDARKLAQTHTQLFNQRKQQLQLEALELKKNNLQAIAAAREEIKMAREKAAQEKQAARDAVAAGRERIQQLKQEQAEIERIAEAERNRTAAERQNVEGNFNPGGGAGNARPKSERLVLTAEEKDIVKLAAYNQEVSKLTKEIDAAKAAFKAGDISQSAYIKTLVRNSIEIKNNKENISSLTKEMKLNASVNDSERNSLGRAQALINQYTNEKKKLNLATEDGRRLNDNYNKAIQKTNEFILKNADAETVRTKTVGKYGEAIVSAGTKAFSVLRTIANILPGFGIGGLIALLVEPIIDATKALFGFGQVSESVRMKQEAIATAYKNAADSVGEEISKVTVLTTVLQSENASRLQKKSALEELKKINYDYFGQLDIENGKVTGLGNAYDLYIQKLIRSITAKASIEQLTEVIKKQQQAVGELNKKGFGEGNKTAENLTEFEIFRTIQKYNLDFGSVKGQTTILSARQRSLIAQLLNSEVQIKEITDRIKLDIDAVFDPTKPNGKDGKDAQLQALKNTQDTSFERFKIAQEAKLRLYDADIKSDRVYYLDKLVALKNYVKESQALIHAQEREDIANKKREADREIKRLNEEKRGKNPEQIARINENIRITEENLQQDILLIQAKYADQSLVLSQNASTIKLKILEDQAAKEKALYDEIAKYQADVDAQTDARIKKGFEKRLAEEKKAAEKKIELEKQLQDKKMELAMNAESFLFTLEQASLTRQLNALQALREAAESKAARDIEIANASTGTEEEKAAKIIVIEARLQAQKAQLDKRARDVEVQKAKFQRAQQIFEITIGAIKAVAAIKAQAAILLSNPLTAALASTAIAQIPIVIGGAALSVAGILATPIQRFFKGKGAGNNYEGPALVNDHPDGSTMEVIERADGTIEMPTGRNVLTHVGRNDIIHSDADKFRRYILNKTHKKALLSTGVTAPPAPKETNSMQKVERLLKVIADKPVQSISTNERGIIAVLAHANKVLHQRNLDTDF